MSPEWPSGERVPMQNPGERRLNSIQRVIAEEAYKEYHAHWSAQSFERLHERGGFGVEELVVFLYWRIKRLEEKP